MGTNVENAGVEPTDRYNSETIEDRHISYKGRLIGSHIRLSIGSTISMTLNDRNAHHLTIAFPELAV